MSAALVAGNAWVSLGAFEAVAQAGGSVEYVFVSASFAALIVCTVAACGAILMVYAAAGRRSGDPRVEPPFERRNDYLRPLRWLALSLVPMLALVLPLGSQLAPLWYVLFDLRWFWWPLVLFEVLRRARITRQIADERRWRMLPIIGLPIVPLAMGVLFTPHLRFSGVLHGDEPKYLRFCENLFQGQGFDISGKRLLPDAPGPAYPRIGENLRHLVGALREESVLIATDMRRLVVTSDSPRLVAGEPSPSMFFAGKHPGTVYQLHNPGVSFLLFPGYVLDRALTGSGVGYQREFPAYMPAVHVCLMALFAGYTVALYRLLHAYTGHRVSSWVLAAMGSVTLPTGAFVFQIYPEIAAGLVLFILVRALISPSSKASTAFGYGVLTGFLPWLHIRFGLVSAVILGGALIVTGREWRRQAAVVLGAAIPLALLALYTYRLTGSMLPMATYGSEAPLSLERMLRGVPAFALDAVWGVLPHTPIYLLSIPGLVVAWRRRTRSASMVLFVAAAVVLPAAAHGFWAGGSTPGRYLVPVAPLFLVFVADAIVRWSRHRSVLGAFIVLALASVETAVRYNLHHVKDVGPLVPHEFSGWRINLLFPSLGTGAWTSDAVTGLGAWGAVLVVVVVAAWVWERGYPEGRLRFAAVRVPSDVMVGLFVLAAVGFACSAGRQPFDPAYLVPAKTARERALSAFADLDGCALCYSSKAGAVPPPVALGNDVGLIDLRTVGPPARTGVPVRIRVRPRTPKAEYLVGDLRVEFGDGAVDSHARVFGDLVVTHVYRASGEYTVRASVSGSSGHPIGATLPLLVTD